MNFTNYSINLNKTEIVLNPETIRNMVCTQLNDYIKHFGLGIIIFYLFYTWFAWYFFNYGYKRIHYDNKNKISGYIGNLENKETRIYWDNFIKERFIKFMIGFIIVILYLTW